MIVMLSFVFPAFWHTDGHCTFCIRRVNPDKLFFSGAVRGESAMSSLDDIGSAVDFEFVVRKEFVAMWDAVLPPTCKKKKKKVYYKYIKIGFSGANNKSMLIVLAFTALQLLNVPLKARENSKWIFTKYNTISLKVNTAQRGLPSLSPSCLFYLFIIAKKKGPKTETSMNILY